MKMTSKDKQDKQDKQHKREELIKQRIFPDGYGREEYQTQQPPARNLKQKPKKK